MSSESMYALGKRLSFAELGCVSPDYPYLGLGQGFWADQMHYKNTAAFLRSGVAGVQKLAGAEREKALAWFLGVACHMTADMTIHPIVEKIVGPYEQNKAAHRKCEMHQDAFIFPKLNVGDVGLTQHLNTGIASCGEKGSALELDKTIKALWLQMLSESYPSTGNKGAPEPKPDHWHAGFCTVLKAVKGATELFPFARHVAANSGLVYPKLDQVSTMYVKDIMTPEGAMDYYVLFDKAISNILKVWLGLDSALSRNDTASLAALEDWNLDTGRSVTTGKYVFWSN
ncbi:zinc dependent phospholipase C family protein [Acidovorax sp. SUPP2539]|nr:zinc dependent phospholipase C family protein [Acidovorax sp. SUPP2539]